MKLFLAAGAAAFALASCSEDQTEFSVSNVPGRAKITGTIVYNQGTTIENGRFSYNYKPLASHEVILEVPNSYYKSGAQGVTVFSTNTNADGKYTFDIPATDLYGNGTISIRPFEGTTTTIKVVDQKPKAETAQAIFRGSVEVDIKDRGLEIKNFQCIPYSVGVIPESFTKSVAFKTVIGQNMEYKTPITPLYNSNNTITGYSDARVNKVWQPASGVDFVVAVSVSGVDFSVYGTTDSKGECTLQIPVDNIPATLDCRITPVSYLGKYTHYVRGEKPVERKLPSGSIVTVYDYEAVTLDGYYQSSGDVTNTAPYEFSNFVQEAECKSMVFHVTPGSDSEGYTPYNWSQSDPWLADFLEDQSK